VTALAAEAGCRLIEGQARTAAADIHADQGAFDRAGSEARRAVAIHRETGYRLGEARALMTLARAVAGTGAEDAAEAYRSAAGALFDGIGGAATGPRAGAHRGEVGADGASRAVTKF
jgi:hypothetical protein